MPGFAVGPFRGKEPAVPTRHEYYYTYTWSIASLFEDQRTQSSLALISLKDAGLPTFTVNKETYVGSSLEYKYAKSVTWDDIKVSWYDSVGLVEIIRQWRSLVWSTQDGIAEARMYKKRSELTTYLPTGKQDVRWILENSWPSVIRYGDLTYTNCSGS